MRNHMQLPIRRHECPADVGTAAAKTSRQVCDPATSHRASSRIFISPQEYPSRRISNVANVPGSQAANSPVSSAAQAAM